MDDLLIVRRTERCKERFARRNQNAPVGMNLGLVLGVSLGLAFAFKWEANPILGLVIGLALGAIIGGIMGKFISPPRKRSQKPLEWNYRYDGMPFDDKSEETPSATPTD